MEFVTSIPNILMNLGNMEMSRFFLFNYRNYHSFSDQLERMTLVHYGFDLCDKSKLGPLIEN